MPETWSRFATTSHTLNWFDEFARPISSFFCFTGLPLAIARRSFRLMRRCGANVRELMHDGCPVACVADAPFGYVNAFTAHVNVGFFQGAELPDPSRLLEGTGKRMRHVKLRPGASTDSASLGRLIDHAYADIKARQAREAADQALSSESEPVNDPGLLEKRSG